MDKPNKHVKRSIKILTWVLKPELLEEIEGNLLEYADRVKDESYPYVKYSLQFLSYLRPSTIRFFQFPIFSNMFLFSPRLALRTLLKHKASSSINLVGFSVGITCAFLIYFYISQHLSTDSFHSEGSITYRLLRTSGINGEGYKIGVTSGPYAEALENDFPNAIKNTCRVSLEEDLIVVGAENYNEDKIAFADENFFTFFDFPLAFGDRQSVLSEVNAVVISRELATKYFGDKDPLGRTISYNYESDFIITGVMGPFPARSHLDFDMVFNIAFVERHDWFNQWWNNGLVTYLKIGSSTQAQQVASQFGNFMEKYFGEDFKRTGARMGLILEPFNDIYFNNETRFDNVNHGNLSTLKILGGVGLAIIFIACFNFVNLSIAQSMRRAKEVSIRKVLGGNRGRLIAQFLGESTLLLSISLLLSFVLTTIFTPFFNSFFNITLDIDWMSIPVLTFVLILLLIVVVFSALYPALLISSFHPLKSIKGGNHILSGKNYFLRKGLVIMQFAMAIFLIAATLFMQRQLSFVNTTDLGFDVEGVSIIKVDNTEIYEKLEGFKEDLLAQRGILEVSSMTGEPGGFHDGTIVDLPGFDNVKVRTVFTDLNYLDVFDIQVIHGRGFSKDFSSEQEAVALINQSALKMLGVKAEKIIGNQVTLPYWNDIERKIIGVVEDYHFTSLKDKIDPLIIVAGEDHRQIAIKYNERPSQHLARLAASWEKFVPSYPMSHSFLDDGLARLYQEEKTQSRVFTSFSIISIILACLGILGLANFSAQQRKKEIAIRKVLGARVSQILLILNKEYLVLLGISLAVAVPTCTLFVEKWLGTFAYHINALDHPSIYFISGAVVILLSVLAISARTFRSALSNPVESIRHE